MPVRDDLIDQATLQKVKLAGLAIRLLLNSRGKQRSQLGMLTFQVQRERPEIPRSALLDDPNHQSRHRSERQRKQPNQPRIPRCPPMKNQQHDAESRRREPTARETSPQPCPAKG